tara:strand:+ start:18470 stop:18835 length:366 start_codon:yes stop_codon:yes gene_type:complete
MSEGIGIYEGSQEINSLEAFNNRPCGKHYLDEGYKEPTPEEVKALLTLSGLNKKDWAMLLGVTYNDKRGSTTLRKWTMNKEASDYRQISYSVWRLMLIYSGVVKPEQDVVFVNNKGVRKGV